MVKSKISAENHYYAMRKSCNVHDEGRIITKQSIVLDVKSM